jgi:hypothetical protein
MVHWSFAMSNNAWISRRTALGAIGGTIGALFSSRGGTAARPVVVVHKDPNCGCCTGWVEHLARAGFHVTTIDTAKLDAVKERLGVPADLAACHTAEVDGYVAEGHVPALALRRFLDEKPKATGLAVPGMPGGSPGMEGASPETYAVVQFGPQGRKEYMRFRGGQAL